jgi:ferredoxin
MANLQEFYTLKVWKCSAGGIFPASLCKDFPGGEVTYVIAEPCIGTKDNSCVEVCPVDCIHPTPDEPEYDAVEMLYIDPEECIDCDACVEACPVDAIFAEDQVPEEWQRFIAINADYFRSKAA